MSNDIIDELRATKATLARYKAALSGLDPDGVRELVEAANEAMIRIDFGAPMPDGLSKPQWRTRLAAALRRVDLDRSKEKK